MIKDLNLIFLLFFDQAGILRPFLGGKYLFALLQMLFTLLRQQHFRVDLDNLLNVLEVIALQQTFLCRNAIAKVLLLRVATSTNTHQTILAGDRFSLLPLRLFLALALKREPHVADHPSASVDLGLVRRLINLSEEHALYLRLTPSIGAPQVICCALEARRVAIAHIGEGHGGDSPCKHEQSR